MRSVVLPQPHALVVLAGTENPVWYNSVFGSLLEAEFKAWEDEFIAGYEDKIVSDDEVINNAVAAFKQISANAQ